MACSGLGFRLIGVWLQGAEPLSRVPPRPLSRLGLVPVPLLRAFKKASGNRWQQVDAEETYPHQFLGPGLCVLILLRGSSATEIPRG